MRRIVLILALTALLVAWALATGSAGAQNPLPEESSGCEALANVDTAQDVELPEAIQKEYKEGYPGQGDEESAVDDVEQNLCATPKEP